MGISLHGRPKPRRRQGLSQAEGLEVCGGLRLMLVCRSSYIHLVASAFGYSASMSEKVASNLR